MTSPSGDYWELYVSKTALPAWREGNSGFQPGMEFTYGTVGLLEIPFMVLSFLWSSILVPLGRILVLLPVSVARGRRSHAVRIEALSPYPRRQLLLWMTTDVHKERVLDEIAAGLAQGKVVCPAGAVYSGQE